MTRGEWAASSGFATGWSRSLKLASRPRVDPVCPSVRVWQGFPGERACPTLPLLSQWRDCLEMPFIG